VIALAIGAAVGWRLARDPDERFVTRLPWLAVAIVAVDATALEPLGIDWLPSDRVVDAAFALLVAAAGLAVGRAIEAAGRRRPALEPAAAAVAIAAIVVLALPGASLTLWPRREAWPTAADTERGLRLRELWTTLRGVPEGRVLFVRSGVPLVFGIEWWRPHTHVTAVTPRYTGRAIVNGTFTHPSPIAAVVYRGDAGRGAIRGLVERLDGRSLFGRPLGALDSATFDRYADRLGVSAVVALDDDVPSLDFLRAHPGYARAAAPAPFLVYARRAPLTLPRRVDAGHWSLAMSGAPGDWTTTRVTYYPLWRASDGPSALETRRGAGGDLEVRLLRSPATIELSYGPGAVEIAGLAVSLVGVMAWGVALRPSVAARRA
jgi:hypothetical protein